MPETLTTLTPVALTNNLVILLVCVGLALVVACELSIIVRGRRQ